MMKRIAILGVVVAFLVGAAVWANCAPDPLPPEATASRIVVEKGRRLLTLYANDTVLSSYHIALGREPVGAKEREGDNRTPEGLYIIDSRNTQSAFHRALHVSYPSPADAARAQQGGYTPGGAIMIHGIHNGLGWLGRAHRTIDWTRGCIAVTNDEIEEIWRVVPDGTPVEIRP